MGFKYLGDRTWAEITREERFFCQHLYQMVCSGSVTKFAEYLNEQLDLGITTNSAWELGFEVCFYRDYCHEVDSSITPFSLKRTFDLCLFGEDSIVIIEAKAAQQFSIGQVKSFLEDLKEIQQITNVDRVALVGICSSQHPKNETVWEQFEQRIVSWESLSEHFGEDSVLARADCVFVPGSSGSNSDAWYSGEELMAAFDGGANYWVGRGGGIDGTYLKDDIEKGNWRKRRYEVNTSQIAEAPSRNYFPLEKFASKVGHKKASSTS